jgi:hypothetical protein
MKSDEKKPPFDDLMRRTSPAILALIMRLASELTPERILVMRLAVKLYFQANWVCYLR